MRTITAVGAFLLISLTAQLSLAASNADGVKQLEFKGLNLGTNPEDARATFLTTITSWTCAPGVEKTGTGRCVAEGITFAQSPTRSVEFGYAESRLSIVVATLDQQAFASAVSALRAKYGAPNHTKQSTVANLTGARLPQVQHTWVLSKVGSVTATLRGQLMDTAEIVYRSPERIAAENIAKKAAKPDI